MSTDKMRIIAPHPEGEMWTINLAHMPDLVKAYVEAMETQRTDKWCRCEWLIHPDDVDKPEGSRRKRRGAQAWDCPVHTKEGMVLYFFQWVLENQQPKSAPEHDLTHRHIMTMDETTIVGCMDRECPAYDPNKL